MKYLHTLDAGDVVELVALHRNGQFNYIPDAMEVKRRLGVN